MGRGTRGWGDGGTWRGNMAGWRAPQQPDKTAGSTYFGLRRSVAARPGSELSYANDFNVGNAVKQLIWTGVFVHRLSLLRLNWFFPNPIQRIRGSTSHRQRRPPLRPAVSPLIWTAVTGNTSSPVFGRATLRHGSAGADAVCADASRAPGSHQRSGAVPGPAARYAALAPRYCSAAARSGRAG